MKRCQISHWRFEHGTLLTGEGRIGNHAVAALVFSGIQSAIRAVDDQISGFARVGYRYARRERNPPERLRCGAVDDFPRGDIAANGFAEIEYFRQGHVAQQEGKLFPAETVGAPQFFNPAGEALGDEAQHLVSHNMAVLIVEILEEIDIGQHEAEFSVGAADKRAQILLEAAAVGQMGERIGIGGDSRFREISLRAPKFPKAPPTAPAGPCFRQ
jgi:hypothetical protein